MTINIDPVIGTLGPFQFRWYGLIMAAAVALGVVIFSRGLARRGIGTQHAWGIALIAVPCGVIGARLVHVFENLGYFWHHPGEIFGLQLVGLAIYGVIGGGLVGLIAYCLWKRLPLLKVLDSTALAFPVAQIIGKTANVINGDTWGNPTDLPWGITYVNPYSFIPDDLLGVATHPNPIYEQIWLLVVVGILLVTIPRLKTAGLAFCLYIGLYSVGRFFLSFLRINKIIVLGLREAQVIALATLVVALALGTYLWWRQRRRTSQKPHRSPAKGRRSASKA